MAVRTNGAKRRRGKARRRGKLLGERAVRIRAGHKRVLRVRVPRARRKLIRRGRTRVLRVAAVAGRAAAAAVQRPVQARAPALIVLLAVGLRLVYGPGHLGYDAVWALEWGREAAGGALPGFEASGAPTPHPLANAVSLVVAPLGVGMPVMMALSWLSFSALGVLAFLLGRRLYSVWVGAAFAVVVLTRSLLVSETHQAVVDIPFLALVVGRAARRGRAPARAHARAGPAVRRRPAAARGLAARARLARLRRPRAAARAGPALGRAGRRRAAAVGAVATSWSPATRCYSLHGTQDLAEQLERPREVGTAFSALPAYLRDALGDPIMWLGLAGAAAGLLSLYERTLLPAALAAAGLLGFLALGLADLPLLIRYLLVPAVMLCLFCGLLAFGWTVRAARATAPGARGWPAGVVCLVAVAAYAPRQARALRDAARARGGDRRDPGRPAPDRRHAGLPLSRRALPDALRPDERPRALLALLAGAHPADDPGAARHAPRAGSVLVYADAGAGPALQRIDPTPPAGSAALPAGGRRVARNASWLVVEDC